MHTRFSRTRYLAGSFALWICLYVGMFHLFLRSVIVLLENPTFWLISVSLRPFSIMERISFNTGSLIFMRSPHVPKRQGRIQQPCADPLQAGGIAAVVDDVYNKAPQCADDHENREEHFQNIHCQPSKSILHPHTGHHFQCGLPNVLHSEQSHAF